MRFGFLRGTALGGLLFCALWASAQAQPKPAAVPKAAPAAPDATHAADREAIVQSAKAYEAAYEKSDAAAVAALWTEQGEHENEDGTLIRGRAAIERAFTAFFKDNPPGELDVVVEQVTFPAPGVAIEEGLSRSTAPGKLPTSCRYRAVHAKADGQWKIVTSREWGSDVNRMADLEWLIGEWKGEVKGNETTVTIAKEKVGAFLVAEFISTVDGKKHSLGTMKIGVDQATGEFHSWHFDADGGHGEGVWIREGKHWMIDSHGVRGDGAPTAGVSILSRNGANELGWRVIERSVAGQPQPDAKPVVLKRVPSAT
ncbi:MAG TPA: SgcJ/EcaC family oxidoreductase [Pirellulales bacterium]